MVDYQRYNLDLIAFQQRYPLSTLEAILSTREYCDPFFVIEELTRHINQNGQSHPSPQPIKTLFFKSNFNLNSGEKPKSQQNKPSSTPFQRTLYLTNLPPTIKTSHFHYILSHPVHFQSQGRRGRCKQDPGISMVQIYHLPAPSPKTKPSRLEWLNRRINQLLCITDPTDNDQTMPNTSPRNSTIKPVCPASNTPPASEHTPTPAPAGPDEIIHTEDNGSRVEEREVPDPESTSPEQQEDDQLLMNIGKNESGEVRTVAWIHFRDEDHLYRAKHVLRSITIDGRQIGIKIDRFNGGIVKRIWRGHTVPAKVK
ncbi:hypothetical protein I302_108024 [Kwoniella bestiolae CBS 10118]|uniref:Uncharacterized protein n=1 Tax=Kwoniella bestiolae CBS 10118 TaxID=1296100 RepID=A0A1B9FWV4_9TREE|nr:hypothetical protein I302_07610 [Kwoniella bestiolae CBS 10118]OCF23256.1 hypothetical protein I302_07610 [Kwoniella bestiolae CBS 10118]